MKRIFVFVLCFVSMILNTVLCYIVSYQDFNTKLELFRFNHPNVSIGLVMFKWEMKKKLFLLVLHVGGQKLIEPIEDGIGPTVRRDNRMVM